MATGGNCPFESQQVAKALQKGRSEIFRIQVCHGCPSERKFNYLSVKCDALSIPFNLCCCVCLFVCYFFKYYRILLESSAILVNNFTATEK